MARPRIAILGAGAAGICMGARLRQAGRDEFTIFEKATDLGGTWRENTYPGASCDIPSLLYCFSFAPKTDWTRKFATQPEILDYLRSVVDRFQLAKHVRFGKESGALDWDDERRVWRLRFTDGSTEEFEIVVSAIGQLHVPKVPRFEGDETFGGRVVHTARFGEDVVYDGSRVVVVGNAASAVQLVPAVARTAASVEVFQRSPSWIGLRNDKVYTPFDLWLFRTFPFVPALIRLATRALADSWFPLFRRTSRLRGLVEWYRRRQMRSRVGDPALAEKLVPTHPIGCTRFLFTDDYLESFSRPNVTLVTRGIARFAPEGVVTDDEQLHPADLVVLATGFETLDFLARLPVVGRAGRSLSAAYAEGGYAYLGMTVPMFPNLFQLYGPNTNLGHNSILIMVEAQTAHVIALLDRMDREGARSIEVTEETMRAYDVELRAELDQLVFAGDCQSWYKRADGRVTNNWAFSTGDYERRTRETPDAAYRLER